VPVVVLVPVLAVLLLLVVVVVVVMLLLLLLLLMVVGMMVPAMNLRFPLALSVMTSALLALLASTAAAAWCVRLL
jgi:hypothetical protein